MRLFGILLIVLNLLAGGAFVYLATQDWKGRQAINAAGLRHLLLLQGLPLEPAKGAPEGFDADDETPFVVEMAGGESTETVSKKLLESYFQANTSAGAPEVGAEAPAGARIQLAASTPVTNQIAEVKRVKQLIDAELAKADLTPAAKISLLRGWLLYQAETYGLRQEYESLASPRTDAGQNKTAAQLDADLKKLQAILDARFNAVLDPAAAPATVAPPAALPDLKALAAELETLRKEQNALTGDLEKAFAEWLQLEADLEKLKDDNKPAAEIQAKQAAVLAKQAEIQAKQAPIQAKQTATIAKQKELDAAVDLHAVQLSTQAGGRAAAGGIAGERRVKLAHLLVHLDRDAAWQKRAMVVVGMRRYVTAVADQAERFAIMIKHVELGLPGDQAAYQLLETQLRVKAEQYSARARSVAAERAKLVEQKTAADDAVSRRQTQLDQLKAQLEAVKAEVDQLLVRQTDIENQLYAVQREVALTLEEVYRLEDLLAATERERYALPPK